MVGTWCKDHEVSLLSVITLSVIIGSLSSQHMAESLARMPTARFQDHGTSVP